MTEPLLDWTGLEEFRSASTDRVLMAAGQSVRSYCGWHIAPEVTETVTVEGSGVALLLPTLRLTGVMSIVRDDVTIDLTNVKWKPNGIVTGYAFGGGDYEVTFTHGYDETPEDVAQVVADIASDSIDGLRRVKSWTKGPFSTSYDTAADPDRAVLDRYRLTARP